MILELGGEPTYPNAADSVGGYDSIYSVGKVARKSVSRLCVTVFRRVLVAGG